MPQHTLNTWQTALRVPIYGSGVGDARSNQNSGAATGNIMADLNSILMLPFTVLNQILAPLSKPVNGALGDENRRFREFTPHGEVVQTMSTTTLNRKNIFGTGGSQ